jgi:hypothetical protein
MYLGHYPHFWSTLHLYKWIEKRNMVFHHYVYINGDIYGTNKSPSTKKVQKKI